MIHTLEECHTCMLVKHLVALQGLPSGQVTMDLGNIELTMSLKQGCMFFHLDISYLLIIAYNRKKLPNFP